ncbi:polysaccharide deacetylase [Pseudopedobacter saltans DSM 12145]|uniref:Polysaccharide deacetylase n=1 Tax=Pseudopedobacter saltans (strain ATCC 51119 / DSM 12145 / JCM 21818 / CCUG 39354 / LMG 10337 / NBRC 100064 / NCIMB 13643) TaxID=762903 RepID=F0S7U3_PSESL|nr:polysaccharide deacetylase [Pseudopedobacter saltans DSM 12145]
MILLSFDIEEFDMPFEYGRDISFEDQIAISVQGTEAILDILEKKQVKATFFSTVVFAEHAKNTIRRIIDSGHELASHGYYHSDFKAEHLALSKKCLEELSGVPVRGFRMARMQPVDEREVTKAGYDYNSSINPTFLPGRYNNLSKPRRYYREENVWQIPASVSPLIRFPLFWLSFHNLPLGLYTWMCKTTIQKDGYLNTYFHPWEFTDLDQDRFGFPGYVRRNTGIEMIKRFDRYISFLKGQGYSFGTFSEFIQTI